MRQVQMANALRTLEGWFFSPTDTRQLLVQRAGFGAVLVYYYLHMLPNVAAFFGPQGLGGFDTREQWPTFPGTLVETRYPQFRWLDGVESAAVIYSVYALLLVSSLCFCVGLFSRTSGVIATLLHLMFTAQQPDVSGGWVSMIPAFILYVVLAAPGRAFSVDSWMRKRRARRSTAAGAPSPEHALPALSPYVRAAWPLRLMRVHVIAMYIAAGVPRFVQPGWYNGETVYNAVSDARFGRFPVFDWYEVKPVLTALAYYAFILEPLAAVLLWFPRTRHWCALALIALHMGIEILSDVGMWQFTMSVAVLCFLPPHWFRRWLPDA